MDDAEFRTKCFLLDIEIEPDSAKPSRWVIWRRVTGHWYLLCLATKPDGYCAFTTKEEALKAFISEPGKFIWN